MVHVFALPRAAMRALGRLRADASPVLTTAVVACAVGLTGCGCSPDGGGAGTTSTTPEPTNTACSPAFGAPKWPGACWRRYDATDSPFYLSLVGAYAPKAANSATVRQYLEGNMPGQDPKNLITVTVDQKGNAGEPTYYSQPGDPQFTIHCLGSEFHTGSNPCPIEGHKLRIPENAQREGGAFACGPPGGPANTPEREHDHSKCDADRHMTVVDQGVEHPGKWEYDLWRVQTVGPTPNDQLFPNGLPKSGGILNIAWGGRVDMSGTGLAEPAASAQAPPGDGTAAGWGDLAGRLTAEDLAQPEPIKHALFITIQCVGIDPDSGKAYVWPARKPARLCSKINGDDTKAPPTGSLFRLDMPYGDIEDLDKFGIKPWKKKILHALADYGAYVGDTGSTAWFTIETESSYEYLIPNGYSKGNDPWWSFASQNGWETYTTKPQDGTIEPGIPQLLGRLTAFRQDDTVDWNTVWSHLELLQPCVANRSCIN